MVDCIIVGQGLAGSILAFTLMQRGKRVLVVDPEHSFNASRIAPGMMSPITGQRMTKTVGVDACQPIAKEFYRNVETFFKLQFFTDQVIERLFTSASDTALWIKRMYDPAYAPYMEPIDEFQTSGKIFGGGSLNTVRLLDAFKQFFIERESFIAGTVAYHDVTVTKSGVTWQGIAARKLIWCQGYLAQDNPWVPGGVLRPTKGEVLTIKINGDIPEHIMVGDYALVPLGNGVCRIGATYDRIHINELPTEQALQQLVFAIPSLVPSGVSFEVISHQAGVRPTTVNQLPMIGMSECSNAVGFFGGFGSKGVLWIPWHAHNFADRLFA